MPQAKSEAKSENGASRQKRAVIYLRVSSDQQVDRGFGEEGYSIPAQREACRRKAADLGATVTHEYVDLAKTAKTRNRPRFMEMVADIEGEQNVDYVIVHKLNRFARNAMDDAVIDYRLNQAGAQLVSVLEHIDATPAGKLNHRIHAAFSEYENENLANEIRKGQIQKHLAGGTPFTAPVGYKHAPVEFAGRLINSIILDEERAPLIQLAFELYDTGEYSITRLRDTLEELGLTCRPTRTRVARPLSRAGVHTMLRNPYYAQVVVYMGKKVKGRHPRLIDQALFDRVQARMDAQRIAGERPKRHMHYLKGTLTCDKCGSRMIFGRHRGRTGAVYDYFSCVNRRARNGGTCDSGHYRVEHIEIEVAALYFRLQLTRQQIAKVRREITEHAEEHTTTIQRAAERHRRRLKKLEDEQAKLLEASDVISKNVLRRQTGRIEAEEKNIHQLLGRSEVQLADIRQSLEDALTLVAKPIETYLDAGDLGRRLLNQVFFSEIRVGEHGEVCEATIVPTYARIIAPRLVRRRSHDDEVAIAPKAAQGRRNPGPLSLGPGFDRDKNGAP